jgi:hypothetical protein
MEVNGQVFTLSESYVLGKTLGWSTGWCGSSDKEQTPLPMLGIEP